MLVSRCISSFRRRYYHIIDGMLPFRKTRWSFTICLVLLYIERSYGMPYYIITYLIGFYLLQLLVNYLTPKGLEEEPQEYDDFYETEVPSANTNFQPYQPTLTNQQIKDDRRPLVPSMSQIQIWERTTFAFLMGIICTCFKLLEVDVFWPTLVVYFVLLACLTIRKIIGQMTRNNYSLQDFAKEREIYV